MSKFERGDRVRIFQITDIDLELVYTTKDECDEAGIGEHGPQIGDTATVGDYICDYYDLELTLDRNGELFAIKEADLERI